MSPSGKSLTASSTARIWKADGHAPSSLQTRVPQASPFPPLPWRPLPLPSPRRPATRWWGPRRAARLRPWARRAFLPACRRSSKLLRRPLRLSLSSSRRPSCPSAASSIARTVVARRGLLARLELKKGQLCWNGSFRRDWGIRTRFFAAASFSAFSLSSSAILCDCGGALRELGEVDGWWCGA